MGTIEQAKNALGGSLYYYRETARWSGNGTDSLRNGRNALAGGQYTSAATEFTQAAAQFNQGAGESKSAHDSLEVVLKDLPNTDILTWSQGTTESMQGYATTAQQLSSEATSIANLPPQAAAIAAARAASCLGEAAATIATAEEVTAKICSMILSIEDLQYTV